MVYGCYLGQLVYAKYFQTSYSETEKTMERFFGVLVTLGILNIPTLAVLMFLPWDLFTNIYAMTFVTVLLPAVYSGFVIYAFGIPFYQFLYEAEEESEHKEETPKQPSQIMDYENGSRDEKTYPLLDRSERDN